MKTLFALVAMTFIVSAPAFAAEQNEHVDRACKKAADESIANSRDSDATFDHVDGSTYVYGVSRGKDDPCFYDIDVKIKKNANGTCTAGKAEFDDTSANCG